MSSRRNLLLGRDGFFGEAFVILLQNESYILKQNNAFMVQMIPNVTIFLYGK